LKVVVTGGAGFIGSEFVRALLKNDFRDFGLLPSEVIVIDALTYAGSLSYLSEIENDSRYTFIHGNITNAPLMSKITQNCDLIVNFAAESHVDRSIENPIAFVETNIMGVQTVLDAARLNSVRRVIQVSTDEVYGSIISGSWTEESPLLPNSPYSASKASGDLIARAYNRTYGLDVIITRCSNNFGPFQHTEKFIPKLITNMIHGVDLPIYGDGSNVREWIHVSEHARAIAFIAINGYAGEIYNIGSPIHLSNLELVEEILHLFGETKSKLILVPDRLGHDFRYSLDSRKLTNLGFHFKNDFLERLSETISWYKSPRF
jgi:dTDP-glucose 4,6-dehydratase